MYLMLLKKLWPPWASGLEGVIKVGAIIMIKEIINYLMIS